MAIESNVNGSVTFSPARTPSVTTNSLLLSV
jgi:hypothetical protein